jgi:hypothetical protein
MSVTRQMRLWSAVVEHAGGGPVTVENVCATAMLATGVGGATIVVALDSGRRETVHVSDPVASEIEEQMETLGEGPGVDACSNGPVLAADLATVDSRTRWPVFAPSAVRIGIRAAFGLPLHVGGIRVGVMDLFRVTPGDLDRDQLADALILADTACALLLGDVDGGTAGDAARWLDQTGPHHPEVHQATGMVTVQLGVSAAVALVRLRAFAFTNDRRLRDVAADVVARRLRFDPEIIR